MASLLSNSCELDLMNLKPFLNEVLYEDSKNLTILAMLESIKVGHIRRCLALGGKLGEMLKSKVGEVGEIVLQSKTLAASLATQRHFMTPSNNDNR